MSLPFTGAADIANSIALNQFDKSTFIKTLASTTAANWISGWAVATVPAAGSTDSGGTQYVNGSGGGGASANAGGLSLITPAVSPQGRVMSDIAVSSSAPITLVIADRLCAIGPTLITTTGSKALTTLPALPRYTNGVGVEAWLEVTTAFNATVPSFFLDSYTGTTNAAGTSSSGILPGIASAPLGTLLGPFPLQSPDIGVQAIASFNISVASGGGAVNVVLLRRLATISVYASGESDSENYFSQTPALPIIQDGATLMLMAFYSSTGAHTISGEVTTVYK